MDENCVEIRLLFVCLLGGGTTPYIIITAQAVVDMILQYYKRGRALNCLEHNNNELRSHDSSVL
jgi:hypothetical protein